jgi:hypothetical protein
MKNLGWEGFDDCGEVGDRDMFQWLMMHWVSVHYMDPELVKNLI